MPIDSIKPLRVCIVAEHASFQFGGEAVLPLHYFSRLRAREIETWLVVHARTRDELTALFPHDQDRILYIEDAWFHKLLFRLSLYLPRRVSEATLGLFSMLLTQSIARRMVRRLVREQGIRVVHQPIPVSPRFPSLMASLGASVIIGPMNGGMDYPAAFRKAESLFSRVSIQFGRRFTNIVNRLLPGKRDARMLLVANERTRLALPAGLRGEVIELVENGVDLGLWAGDPAAKGGFDGETAPVFLYVGRLVDWKRVDIAIEALKSVPGARLEIIGGGGMRGPWEEFARAQGVSDRVSFLGFRPQPECAERLRAAAALVLPSIYECGGAVALEAMAAGAPVVATNWGGPADYLEDSCGFLIEPVSRQALVEGFAEKMRLLAADAALRRRLGGQGRQRAVAQFDWEKKIDRMLELYRQAIETPSFGR